jgi:hypothetical protein
MQIAIGNAITGSRNAAWWLRGATADVDFSANRSFTNGATGGADSVISVSRASAGTAQARDGAWVSFANDTPRRTNLGLLIEEASTNGIRNNSNTGAVDGVIGSGGALPTNWTVTGTGGLTVTVTTATRNGLPTTRVRFAGTPSSTATLTLRWEGTLNVAASSGQVWTNSSYLALTAGSLTNVAATQLVMLFRDAGGNAVAGGSFNLTVALTSAHVRHQRSGTAPATTAAVQPYFACSLTSGQAVDFEIEVSGAQIEQKAFATSPILTTSAAVTRNADVVSLTGGAATAALASAAAFVQTAGVQSAATTPTLFSFNSGQKVYFPTTSSVAINNGSVEAVAVIGAVASTGGPIKTAVNFDGTDFDVRANAGTSDNEVAAFGAVSGTVRLGVNAASGLALNGYIQRLAFSATDATFDGMTTVEPGFFDPFVVDGELTTPWRYIEPAVGPQIVRSYVSDGALVADYSGQASTAAYPFVDMGAPVVDMRARVSWGAGTSNMAVIALIATPLDTGLVSSITTGPSLHITFTDTRCAVEDFVNGVNTTIAILTYPSVLAKDGTQYIIGWQISGDTMTVLMPDGTTRTVTDSRLAAAGGRYAYCEHFWIGTSGIALPSVHDFYCGTSLVR